jgi:hypothetical protein
VDTTQVAPPPAAPRKALPYPADFGNDPEAESLAAEVAAILSTTPARPPSVKPARPAVVAFPSEQWLRAASASLETLPEAERAAAFQRIIERYKRMRSEEKSLQPLPR